MGVFLMAKILVVDDSLVMRRNLKTILTEAGHSIVSEASNGVQAFKEYEKHNPDLVTMDITMPIMDGVQAVKKIIQVFPDAKIIMISALDQKNMVLAALESGAKHYIIKPFTVEKVVGVVNEVMKIKSPVKNPDKTIGEINNAINDIDNAIHSLEENENAENNNNEASEPFTIDNKNGIFMIKINESLNDGNFNNFNMAVSGLLYVKPLKVVFNICDIDTLSDMTLDRIVGIIHNMENVNADVKIAINNERLKNIIINRGVSYDKVYSDISEVNI